VNRAVLLTLGAGLAYGVSDVRGQSKSRSVEGQPPTSDDLSASPTTLARQSPFLGELLSGLPGTARLKSRLFPELRFPEAELHEGDLGPAHQSQRSDLASFRSTPGARSERCAPFGRGWSATCWKSPPDHYPTSWTFEPPYPLRTEYPYPCWPGFPVRLLGSKHELFLNASWAPVEQVRGGSARLASLNAQAMACTTGHCDKLIVRVAARPASNEPETLQFCSAAAAMDPASKARVVGAPVDCQAGAAWDGSRTWLPVWDGISTQFSQQSCGMSGVDYTLSIKGAPIDLVKRKMVVALGQAPFSLVVHSPTRNLIVGVAARGRSSPVLSGYREWGTVSLSLSEERATKTVGVAATITFAVNRQNTANVREGWRPLDETEQARYNDAVLHGLREASSSACSDVAVWLDHVSLECTKVVPLKIPPAPRLAQPLPPVPPHPSAPPKPKGK
jgi:hypothetical protein